MKKFLLITISLFSVCCMQHKMFAQESPDIAAIEKNSLIPEDINDSQPSIYQPEYKPTFFKMFFILFALLALVILTFWIFKKFTHIKLHQGNLTKSIKIIEKRALSPKSLLYLIEIEGKKIVISESSLEIRKLKDIE